MTKTKALLLLVVLGPILAYGEDPKLTDSQKLEATKIELRYLRARDGLANTAVCQQFQNEINAAQQDFASLGSKLCPGGKLDNIIDPKTGVPVAGEWKCTMPAPLPKPEGKK